MPSPSKGGTSTPAIDPTGLFPRWWIKTSSRRSVTSSISVARLGVHSVANGPLERSLGFPDDLSASPRTSDRVAWIPI